MEKGIDIWKQDVNWTDSYWCKVNNEKEYKMACKYLFGERIIKMVYIADVFEGEECLFDDDIESWHYHFDTSECINDDIEFFTHPHSYEGDLKMKPSEGEYPLVLNASVMMDNLQVKWFSI